MKKRNVALVVVFSILTFGIYNIVWLISTKNELNKLGAKIPTGILLFIPIANIIWLWHYAQGVEIATNQKMSSTIAFILHLFLGTIGSAVIQHEFNQLGDANAVVFDQSNTNPTPQPDGSVQPFVQPVATQDNQVQFNQTAPVAANEAFPTQAETPQVANLASQEVPSVTPEVNSYEMPTAQSVMDSAPAQAPEVVNYNPIDNASPVAEPAVNNQQTPMNEGFAQPVQSTQPVSDQPQPFEAPVPNPVETPVQNNNQF